MAGMDMSLCPPADAITREEIARSICPICERRFLGCAATCRDCEGDGE